MSEPLSEQEFAALHERAIDRLAARILTYQPTASPAACRAEAAMILGPCVPRGERPAEEPPVAPTS